VSATPRVSAAASKYSRLSGVKKSLLRLPSFRMVDAPASAGTGRNATEVISPPMTTLLDSSGRSSRFRRTMGRAVSPIQRLPERVQYGGLADRRPDSMALQILSPSVSPSARRDSL
jgi:hypothetical protein